MTTTDNGEGSSSKAEHIGYVMNELARALEEARANEEDLLLDHEEHDRNERIAKLEQALKGSADQLLKFDNRLIRNVPDWVTPEVTCGGGLVTGQFLAALDDDSNTTNESFLTPAGIQRLNQMLEHGTYRIQHVEHGALLCLVWLLQNGYKSEAQHVLETILPYFSQLQFYPFEATTELLQVMTLETSIASVGDVTLALTQKQEQWQNPYIARSRQIMANRAAILRWIPFYFCLLELFEQTVASCCHIPRLATGPHGEILNTEGQRLQDGDKHAYVTHSDCPLQHSTCGWPCQEYSEDWDADASRLLHEYYEIVEEQDESVNKGRRLRGNTYELVKCLKTCVRKGREALTGKQVGKIRLVLAASHAKYRCTGSERWQLIATKLSHAIPPPHDYYYQLLLEQLSEFDLESGISKESIDTILSSAAAAAAASKEEDMPQTTQVPKSIRTVLQRAQLGTIEELVASGIVKSGEVLATLVPVVVATSVSSRITDLCLRRLYYALSIAFQRRRHYSSSSLLLESSQQQVTKIQELPWVKPILAHLEQMDETSATRLALERIVCMELELFPQTIIPNKFLQTIRQLVTNANMNLPLVDEIAADTFDGRFGSKFADAADTAGSVMYNTPYAHYYSLQELYGNMSESFGPQDLLEECQKHAHVNDTTSSTNFVVDNGKVLEWMQIITTHNLATLVYTLDLRNKLEWFVMVIKTWEWIIQHYPKDNLDFDSDDADDSSDFSDDNGLLVDEREEGFLYFRKKGRKYLHMKKNIAYAWRQLMFYVSMMEGEQSDVIVESLKNEMELQVVKQEERDALSSKFLKPLERALEDMTPGSIVLGWE